MNNSQSGKAATRRLAPRKTPSQPRSAQTVETILEGAAHILEQQGLEGYTTNAIAARAGVSIGSLYQYFPTKDAITVALIERESAGLVDEAMLALQDGERRQALRRLIEIAVRYQLRRPKLARLLDVEQDRLSQLLPRSGSAAAMHAALAAFLGGWMEQGSAAAGAAASDVMALVSALTDVAGRRGSMPAAQLAAGIEGAVLGYLGLGREA
ncbi:TetR/AcrR family transcriptional regulator [Duganella sp. HH105]|uniref:TetR/AcrR family transcriptional regulator n=1 Tax=Duganella sp. HH105 TaxID=1781067 RepID=UPI000877E3C6|nr:TetR/AcrR family transcriptional regulator [Duganella sp. HH105]OEZ55440.1 nucleoid occlusion factor SlmA [Duganella sp. HH105]